MADAASKQRPEFRVGVGGVGEAVIDFTTRYLVFTPNEKSTADSMDIYIYMDV